MTDTTEYLRHKLTQLHELDKWRLDANRREHARAQAKEQMKRDQERHERQIARAGAREEIAALRAELAVLRVELATLRADFADTTNVTASVFETLADERHERREEMRDLKTEVAKLG